MLLLNKKDIEKSVDLDGMMDQIEEHIRSLNRELTICRQDRQWSMIIRH